MPDQDFKIILYRDLASEWQEAQARMGQNWYGPSWDAGEWLSTKEVRLLATKRELQREEIEGLVARGLATAFGSDPEQAGFVVRSTTPEQGHYIDDAGFRAFYPVPRSGLAGRLRMKHPFPIGIHRFRVRGAGLPERGERPARTGSSAPQEHFWTLAYVVPSKLPAEFRNTRFDPEHAKDWDPE